MLVVMQQPILFQMNKLEKHMTEQEFRSMAKEVLATPHLDPETIKKYQYRLNIYKSLHLLRQKMPVVLYTDEKNQTIVGVLLQTKEDMLELYEICASYPQTAQSFKTMGQRHRCLKREVVSINSRENKLIQVDGIVNLLYLELHDF